MTKSKHWLVLDFDASDPGVVRAICIAPSFNQPQMVTTKTVIAWCVFNRILGLLPPGCKWQADDRERCKGSSRNLLLAHPPDVSVLAGVRLYRSNILRLKALAYTTINQRHSC